MIQNQQAHDRQKDSVRRCVRKVFAVRMSAPPATSSRWIKRTSSGLSSRAHALQTGSEVSAPLRSSSVPMAASGKGVGPSRSLSRNRRAGEDTQAV